MDQQNQQPFIQKIVLSSPHPAVVSRPQQAVQKPVQTEQITSKDTSFIARHMTVIIVISFLVLIAGGVWYGLTQFIVWDESSTVAQAETADSIVRSVLGVSRNTAEASSSTSEINEESSGTPSITVKGRITVSLTKEDGLAFDEATIRLQDATSGRIVRQAQLRKGTTAVFDEVPAGTYRVEGVKKGEESGAGKTVALGEGEITSVSLALYPDTLVSITVTVKDDSGSPVANQSLTIQKGVGGTEEQVFTVTTNDSGVFTQSGVKPDGKWEVVQGGSSVGMFGVAPTGQNQSINVKLKSS